jgi:membrane-associated phospholipid phosphatase
MRKTAAALLACALSLPSVAAAEPLNERRPTKEYWLHGALVGIGMSGSLIVTELSREHGAGWDPTGFDPDDAVWANFSRSAARTSDVLGTLALALPMAAQIGSGFDTSLANASVIYAEAQAANLLLVSITKELVRRPRPYTHSQSAEVQSFARAQGSEAYVSFYSGHASTTYAAAVSGSLLFAARTQNAWARGAMWGVEMLLAGTTAQLRVRAGRHYRTDIWVGTAVGIGLGVAVPVLHGVATAPRASELGVAGGALLLTLVGEELFDPCDLLGCAPDAEVLEAGSGASSWSVFPFASAAGVGLWLARPW